MRRELPETSSRSRLQSAYITLAVTSKCRDIHSYYIICLASRAQLLLVAIYIYIAPSQPSAALFNKYKKAPVPHRPWSQSMPVSNNNQQLPSKPEKHPCETCSDLIPVSLEKCFQLLPFHALKSKHVPRHHHNQIEMPQEPNRCSPEIPNYMFRVKKGGATGTAELALRNSRH